jgi:spore maturation protein CgeD
MGGKISVILTVYNKPKWLKQCIDSVIAQTYTDWELIILEDNSPDPEIRNILSEYENNPKIKIYYSHISDARRYATARYATLINYGVSAISTGDYITYLTDDDYYYPDRFERMVSYLESSDIEIVYGSQDLLSADDQLIGQRPTYGILNNAFSVVDHNSVMHERHLFFEAGGWSDEPHVWLCADAFFWKRLTDRGVLFYPVEGSPTEAKRMHEDSVQHLIYSNQFNV